VGAAIGDILPVAIAVAISPIPIIAMVLMLTSEKARSNGVAFLAGWLIGLFGLGVLVLLIADASGATDESGAPAAWVGWLVLVLGLLAVLLGVRQWRNRPAPGVEPPTPKWMAAIDQFTAVRSLAIGFVFAAVNPKNTTLTLAAAVSIAAAGLSMGDSIIVLAVFVLIGTIGLAVPLIIYFAMGTRAATTLGELQHWMATHNAAIMAVLFVVIGAKLIGSGISTIAG
jgi:threonine/homoserine/homoserine lactone efflux protein